MVAVCNNLAFLNAREESDLDVFVVVKKGALSFTRFLMVLVSILFFTRPSEKAQKNGLCLSFIVDESSLLLKSFSIFPHDVYLLYWTATLTPLYDYNGIYEIFRRSNKDVLSNLPNCCSRKSAVLSVLPSSFLKRAIEFLATPLTIGAISNFIFQSEVYMLPKSISEKMNKSSAVVVRESVFKTHLNDQRISIENEWQARVRAVS